MQKNPPIRLRLPAALLALAGPALLTSSLLAHTAGAQTLPASAPTQPAPVAAAPTPPPPATPTAASYRAQIELFQGELSVIAQNSSLNQILRDISSLTGMKVTGGVTDERVFGTYGPGPAQDVLSKLLDGTGSNVLLKQDANHAVTELVLTPRQGGVTPPNPNAAREAAAREDTDLPPQFGGRRRGHSEPGRTQPGMPPPAESVAPPEQPATPTAPPTDPNTTTQQSPNGVKTPQEIYEELSKKQQQQTTPPQ